MSKPIRTHVFKGKKYKIKFVPNSIMAKTNADADCDHPNSKHKVIRLVKNGLSEKRALEIAIHEAIHACFWLLDDEGVETASEDIASFLWRMGYRKED